MPELPVVGAQNSHYLHCTESGIRPTSVDNHND